MDTGRIHVFLVATKSGNVVYERFFHRCSELEKGAVRHAFQAAASNVNLGQDGQEFVGQYKSAPFVFIPQLDLVFYCMGSGEYDEAALAEVVNTVMASLRDVLSRPPTESSLLEKYERLCVVIDEVIDEGMVAATDLDAIRKGTKHKGPWEI